MAIVPENLEDCQTPQDVLELLRRELPLIYRFFKELLKNQHDRGSSVFTGGRWIYFRNANSQLNYIPPHPDQLSLPLPRLDR